MFRKILIIVENTLLTKHIEKYIKIRRKKLSKKLWTKVANKGKWFGIKVGEGEVFGQLRQ